MECSKCGRMYHHNRLRGSMFCRCGGIFVAARPKIKPEPDDPAVLAYRKQFEHLVEENEKPQPWNRWPGAIYKGNVVEESLKALRIRIDDQGEPKWIPKSVMDLEFLGDSQVEVWIPDWLMTLPNEKLLELLELSPEWPVPTAWLPKSL